MSDLEIIDHLRGVVDQIDGNAPPALRWLRSEIRALINSPRIRRLQRNRMIGELSRYYPSHGALAAALAHYRSTCWAREQHRSTPPNGSAERQLMWRIYAIGLPVAVTRQGLDIVLAEIFLHPRTEPATRPQAGV